MLLGQWRLVLAGAAVSLLLAAVAYVAAPVSYQCQATLALGESLRLEPAQLREDKIAFLSSPSTLELAVEQAAAQGVKVPAGLNFDDTFHISLPTEYPRQIDLLVSTPDAALSRALLAGLLRVAQSRVDEQALKALERREKEMQAELSAAQSAFEQRLGEYQELVRSLNVAGLQARLNRQTQAGLDLAGELARARLALAGARGYGQGAGASSAEGQVRQAEIEARRAEAVIDQARKEIERAEGEIRRLRPQVAVLDLREKMATRELETFYDANVAAVEKELASLRRWRAGVLAPLKVVKPASPPRRVTPAWGYGLVVGVVGLLAVVAVALLREGLSAGRGGARGGLPAA